MRAGDTEPPPAVVVVTPADARSKALTVGLGLLIVSGLLLGLLAYKQVPEGHVGVTKEWGAVTGETLGPGAHWKIPVMQGVQNVEIRPRTYTMGDTRGEGDRGQQRDAVVVQTVNGTTVRVDVTVRYRVLQDEGDAFVIQWNNVQQMEQRLIRPTVRSELRDEAADIQTSSIYTSTGREALAVAAREVLVTEFEDEAIRLEAVQVRDVDLPDRVDQALDDKEVAKQQVQVEQEKIEQERARAEQRRVEARGEADVIETRGEALRRNPVVLRARYIEALDDGTVYVVPSDGGTPVILDTSGAGNATVATPPAAGG